MLPFIRDRHYKQNLWRAVWWHPICQFQISKKYYLIFIIEAIYSQGKMPRIEKFAVRSLTCETPDEVTCHSPIYPHEISDAIQRGHNIFGAGGITGAHKSRPAAAKCASRHNRHP